MIDFALKDIYLYSIKKRLFQRIRKFARAKTSVFEDESKTSSVQLTGSGVNFQHFVMSLRKSDPINTQYPI